MANNRLARISLRAYNTLILHALKYANPKIQQKEWKIVYGLLYGKFQEEDLIICEAVPMIHGTSTNVEFGVEDYLNCAEVNCEIMEKGCYMLGWYHSHPGRGLFLHKIDIVNQLNYQEMNPDAIALIVQIIILKLNLTLNKI